MTGDLGVPEPAGAVRVGYFLRIPNVGDRVSPMVVSALAGAEARYVANRRTMPHLLAVGSILGSASPASHVWGAGVMGPRFGVGAAVPCNIHALRGKLSHAELKRAGVAVGDAPLGDPAFLAPALLGFRRDPAPRARLGLVCHYVDRDNPTLQRILREEGVVDLNVHDAPEVFLSRAAACEAIASTALHGLVFAEALGIPNLWVKAGDAIGGGAFKFEDWFSTTARPQRTAHLLDADDTAEDLAGRAEPRESLIDTEALAAAFPRHRLAELSDPPRPTLIPVSACRRRPLPTFLYAEEVSKLRATILTIQGWPTPTELIVHLAGGAANDAPAVQELEAAGVKVVRTSSGNRAKAASTVAATVADHFSNWGEPSRYVVADCDGSISNDPDAIAVYDALLDRFRFAECVGPTDPRPSGLIDALKRLKSRLSRQRAWTAHVRGRSFACERTSVGMGLALHRAAEPFHRRKAAVRIRALASG